MPHQWKPEEDEWIRRNYTNGKTRQTIAEEFSAEFGTAVTPGAISTRAYGLGIRGQIKPLKKRKHFWTVEEEDWIRKNYTKGKTCPVLAKEYQEYFGTAIDFHSIQSKAHMLGIRGQAQPPLSSDELEFLRENGGKMRREALAKLYNEKFGTNRSRANITSLCAHHKIPAWDMPATKGLLVSKYPVGAERWHGRKSLNYLYVKVSNTGNREKDWVLKHRYIWEKEYGKIPDDCVISFLDNDRTNFQLDNLCLMTKKEGVIMAKLGWNQICDPELKKAALNACRLQISLRDHGVNSRQCQDRQFGTS